VKLPRAWPSKVWDKIRPPLPPDPYGLLQGPVMFVIHPSGNDGLGPVEHAKGLAESEYRSVCLNAFDGMTKPSDWNIWIRHLTLPWFWWARCYNPAHLERLAELSVGKPAVIFNVEDELVSWTLHGRVTEQDVLEVARPLMKAGTRVGLSTVSPVYHSVDWKRLTKAGVVVMPQAFKNVASTTSALGALIDARTHGCQLVNTTIGLYPTPTSPRLTPADYHPLPVRWSAYHAGAVNKWT